MNTRTSTTGNRQSDVYHTKYFRITETAQQQPLHKGRVTTKDFNAQIVINNSLATVLADTGASISVCGREQARKWNLLSRMVPTNTRSSRTTALLYQLWELLNALSRFGSTSIPVSWHIIDNPCEPVLAGQSAVQLGIISFDLSPKCQPSNDPIWQQGSSSAIYRIFPNFEGLGKLKTTKLNCMLIPTC